MVWSFYDAAVYCCIQFAVLWLCAEDPPRLAKSCPQRVHSGAEELHPREATESVITVCMLSFYIFR